MNILIAEDEKDIRDLISLHMKKENYSVFEACDGQEALEIFEKEKTSFFCQVIHKVEDSFTVFPQ